jgi:hypothetical protein
VSVKTQWYTDMCTYIHTSEQVYACTDIRLHARFISLAHVRARALSLSLSQSLSLSLSQSLSLSFFLSLSFSLHCLHNVLFRRALSRVTCNHTAIHAHTSLVYRDTHTNTNPKHYLYIHVHMRADRHISLIHCDTAHRDRGGGRSGARTNTHTRHA